MDETRGRLAQFALLELSLLIALYLGSLLLASISNLPSGLSVLTVASRNFMAGMVVVVLLGVVAWLILRRLRRLAMHPVVEFAAFGAAGGAGGLVLGLLAGAVVFLVEQTGTLGSALALGGGVGLIIGAWCALLGRGMLEILRRRRAAALVALLALVALVALGLLSPS